jgi:hypothetical protein
MLGPRVEPCEPVPYRSMPMSSPTQEELLQARAGTELICTDCLVQLGDLLASHIDPDLVLLLYAFMPNRHRL